MKVYLVKKDGSVIHHTDLAAMKQLDGIAKPEKTVTIEEWEAAGSTAYIDKSGEIKLGILPDIKARQEEMASLAKEEAELQAELDQKDYKVVKAAETGQIIADTDPELHQRREWCRKRINEIRIRLAELSVVETAA